MVKVRRRVYVNGEGCEGEDESTSWRMYSRGEDENTCGGSED
jgi:hypothetical protein